ncbi:MAG: methyltransferase, partial [Planctomycetota bacterium]
MPRGWTGEEILELVRGFQPACMLVAAAELDLFAALSAAPMTADELAKKLRTDLRATTIIADALVAMDLLIKENDRYSPALGTLEILTESGAQSVLGMVRHLGNCFRNWAQLAQVARTGQRAQRTPSIRGEAADLEAFIEAMDEVSRPLADPLIKSLDLHFTHLLDIGGGPGTWTIAFLRAAPEAKATLYDLPEVIPIARKHVAAAGLSGSVTFAEGNFDTDESLPAGADLAWVSAIVHMNSREENRSLFAKVHAALAPGGQILIRDVVMDDSHTSPPTGAMFAVNMLVNTPGGGTYTFGELSEDLRAAGFPDPTLLQRGEFMDSVIQA